MDELEPPGNANHTGKAQIGSLSKSKALIYALIAMAVLLLLGAIL